MVGVDALEVVTVQRDPGVVDKALEEFINQLLIKLANAARRELHIDVQPRATRKIHHHARKRFVERHIGVP